MTMGALPGAAMPSAMRACSRGRGRRISGGGRGGEGEGGGEGGGAVAAGGEGAAAAGGRWLAAGGALQGPGRGKGGKGGRGREGREGGGEWRRGKHSKQKTGREALPSMPRCLAAGWLRSLCQVALLPLPGYAALPGGPVCYGDAVVRCSHGASDAADPRLMEPPHQH